MKNSPLAEKRPVAITAGKKSMLRCIQVICTRPSRSDQYGANIQANMQKRQYAEGESSLSTVSTSERTKSTGSYIGHSIDHRQGKDQAHGSNPERIRARMQSPALQGALRVLLGSTQGLNDPSFNYERKDIQRPQPLTLSSGCCWSCRHRLF